MKHHAVFKEQRDFSYVGPNSQEIRRIWISPTELAEAPEKTVRIVINDQEVVIEDPITFVFVDTTGTVRMQAHRVSTIARELGLKLIPWRKGQLTRTEHDLRFGPGHFPMHTEFVDDEGNQYTSSGRIIRAETRDRLFQIIASKNVGGEFPNDRYEMLLVNVARVVRIVRPNPFRFRKFELLSQSMEKALSTPFMDPRSHAYKEAHFDTSETTKCNRKGYWYVNHPNSVIYRIFCEISKARGSSGSFCQPRAMAMLHNNGRQLMRKVNVVSASGFEHELYEINKKRMMRWVQTNFSRMQRPYNERKAVTQRNQRRYHTEFDVFGGALAVKHGQRG
jgi:hypothetical protein